MKYSIDEYIEYINEYISLINNSIKNGIQSLNEKSIADEEFNYSNPNIKRNKDIKVLRLVKPENNSSH